MANTRVAPLNTDQREWALKELVRVEEENAALRAENEALKAQLGEVKPTPHRYTPGEGDV